jgi:hypothetical protein
MMEAFHRAHGALRIRIGINAIIALAPSQSLSLILLTCTCNGSWLMTHDRKKYWSKNVHDHDFFRFSFSCVLGHLLGSNATYTHTHTHTRTHPHYCTLRTPRCNGLVGRLWQCRYFHSGSMQCQCQCQCPLLVFPSVAAGQFRGGGASLITGMGRSSSSRFCSSNPAYILIKPRTHKENVQAKFSVRLLLLQGY